MNKNKFALDIDSNRKKTWKINAFLSLFRPILKINRNKNIWVFGAWEGKRYDDNSMYLFEYIIKNEPGINAYWFTRDPEIKFKLTSEGKPCYLIDSVEGISVLKKAGVAFFTNGLDDFGDICYVMGAMLIDLTHAPLGLKDVIHYSYRNNKGIIRLLKMIKHKLYNSYMADYTTVTSEYSRSFYQRAYGDNNIKRYVILGSPRNDLLLCDDSISFIKPLDESYKYILYMPTFRKYSNDVIASFINKVLDTKIFNDFLKEKKYKIIVKPHYADKSIEKINNLNDNVMLFDKNIKISSQELLKQSDIMITDYSSCCFDFSISGKPIFLYVPDLKEYVSFNGLSEECVYIYDKVDLTFSPDELISRIMSLISGKTDELGITEHLNTNYIFPPKSGKSYSYDITKFVKQKIGIID